jgi:hypothetical protein
MLYGDDPTPSSAWGAACPGQRLMGMDVVMQHDDQNAKTLLMVVWRSLTIPHSCCVLMVMPVSSVLAPGSWMTTCWCCLDQFCTWIAGIVACHIVPICSGVPILLAQLIVNCMCVMHRAMWWPVSDCSLAVSQRGFIWISFMRIEPHQCPRLA